MEKGNKVGNEVKRYIGRMVGWEERRTGERKDGRLEGLKDIDR